MAFKATGNLLPFKDTLNTEVPNVIPAVMHEGFFGSGHKIELKMDSRMARDVWVKLGLTRVGAVSTGKPAASRGLNLAQFTDDSGKPIEAHKITIIIE